MALCECGCGRKVSIYQSKPRRFINGHNQRGKLLTEEHKQHISEALRGRKLSEEHKRRVGDANRGRRASPEARRKMSEAGRGRPKTEEHKRKIGEAHKGKRLSEEHRRKLSEAKKGRPLSEEHKRNLREAHKVDWANGVYDGCIFKVPGVAYKGIPMRSTWEARLAQAFDKLGWAWEYESDRFHYELADGPHTYIPDFYVPYLDSYFDPHEARWGHNEGKFEAVREQCGVALIVLSESLLEMYERLAG